jgi:hypothetical protein
MRLIEFINLITMKKGFLSVPPIVTTIISASSLDKVRVVADAVCKAESTIVCGICSKDGAKNFRVQSGRE